MMIENVVKARSRRLGLQRRNFVGRAEGTSMSWRSAERKFARPEKPATGMQTLLKSAGQCSRTQSNAEIAILNCIRSGTTANEARHEGPA